MQNVHACESFCLGCLVCIGEYAAFGDGLWRIIPLWVVQVSGVSGAVPVSSACGGVLDEAGDSGRASSVAFQGTS